MKNKEWTYKDFKIGQLVTCVKISTNKNDNRYSDFWEQHLTVGRQYEIRDLDFHFCDSICIRSDNNRTEMFVPIELFVGLKIQRKNKLNKINNNLK